MEKYIEYITTSIITDVEYLKTIFIDYNYLTWIFVGIFYIIWIWLKYILLTSPFWLVFNLTLGNFKTFKIISKNNNNGK